MITKIGILSLIGGIVVLLGHYVSGLEQYFLIPIGAGLAILAAIIDNWSK